eukprot:352449-Chlamydomonas_euryale.AAC.3
MMRRHITLSFEWLCSGVCRVSLGDRWDLGLAWRQVGLWPRLATDGTRAAHLSWAAVARRHHSCCSSRVPWSSDASSCLYRGRQMPRASDASSCLYHGRRMPRASDASSCLYHGRQMPRASDASSCLYHGRRMPRAVCGAVQGVADINGVAAYWCEGRCVWLTNPPSP